MYERSKYARKIEQINKDILNFCQTDLQLLQQKTILLSKEANKKDFQILYEANQKEFQILYEKLDRMSVHAQPLSMDLSSVPKLNMVPLGLDFPLMELKMKLLDDSLNTLVVSASPGCGKTTLVIQLCHDDDIKGNLYLLGVIKFQSLLLICISCFSF